MQEFFLLYSVYIKQFDFVEKLIEKKGEIKKIDLWLTEASNILQKVGSNYTHLNY